MQKQKEALIYRVFQCKKYDKYKHQFPRMRESELYNKIIKEWSALTIPEKFKLYDDNTIKEFLSSINLEENQEENEESTPVKQIQQKKPKESSKVEKPKSRLRLFEEEEDGKRMRDELDLDFTKAVEEEKKEEAEKQIDLESVEYVFEKPPIKFPVCVVNEGRNRLNENPAISPYFKRVVGALPQKDNVYVAYLELLRIKDWQLEEERLKNPEVDEKVDYDELVRTAIKYPLSDYFVGSRLYHITKKGQMVDKYLRLTTHKKERRIFRDNFAKEYFALDESASAKEILLKFGELNVEEFQEFMTIEKKKWSIHWREELRLQKIKSKKEPKAKNLANNKKIARFKKELKKMIMKQNRKAKS